MADGWQSDVVAGQPILSAWGNRVRDRTVMPFETTGDRDTEIPAATRGMVAHVEETDSLYVHDGSDWVGLARGRIGNDQFDGVTLSAPGDYGVITFDLVEPRLMLLTYSIYAVASTNANATLVVSIAADTRRIWSRSIGSGEQLQLGSGAPVSGAQAFTVGSGGSINAKLSLTQLTAGSLTTDGVFPNRINLWDMGTP